MDTDEEPATRRGAGPSPRRIKRANELLAELPKQGIMTAFSNGSSLAGSMSRRASVLSVEYSKIGTPKEDNIDTPARSVRIDSMDSDDLSGDDTDLEDGPIDPTRRPSGQRTPKEMYCAACKHNRLTPIHEFADQLGKAKIVLKHKSLSAKDIGPMIISLLGDLEVKELHLPANNIGERGMHFITELMLENVDMKVLDVSRNKLGQSGAMALGEVIAGNDNLRDLKAAGNDMHEKDVYYIVDAMQSNFTLKMLDLSHNEFREDGGVLLGHMLEKNEGLSVLNLSWNHLRLKGATEICRGLSHNMSLVHLDLSWNGFGNEGAKGMADALRINTTLESLDLTNNRINAIGASCIAKGLAVNECLQIIRLSQNPISTIGALQLLCSIRDNDNSALLELDIEDVPVTYDLQVVLQDIQDRKPGFKVIHGEFVKSPDVVGARLLSNEFQIDPFKLLMVYAQKEGLRLWDVFAQFDKDGSMSISKDEFKHAIKSADIPINDKNLELLVKQLDKDGDGEVDFGELVEYQKDYIVKERRRKARSLAASEQEKEILKSRRKKLGKGLKGLLPGGSVPLPRNLAVKEPDEPTLVGTTAERPASARLNIPTDELPQGTRKPGSASSKPGSASSKPGSASSKPGSASSKPGSAKSERAASSSSRKSADNNDNSEER